jgi:hypothetical protein
MPAVYSDQGPLKQDLQSGNAFSYYKHKYTIIATLPSAALQKQSKA